MGEEVNQVDNSGVALRTLEGHSSAVTGGDGGREAGGGLMSSSKRTLPKNDTRVEGAIATCAGARATG
jgi:hypothetical protein